MLHEEFEKIRQTAPESLIVTTGECRFCGTEIDVEIPAICLDMDGKREEVATELCGCAESKTYAAKKKKKERTYERIEKLFGSESQKPLPAHKAKVLHDAVDPIVEYDIASIAVDFGNGTKAKMKMTSKGAVQVKRIDTNEYCAEI